MVRVSRRVLDHHSTLRNAHLCSPFLLPTPRPPPRTPHRTTHPTGCAQHSRAIRTRRTTRHPTPTRPHAPHAAATLRLRGDRSFVLVPCCPASPKAAYNMAAHAAPKRAAHPHHLTRFPCNALRRSACNTMPTPRAPEIHAPPLGGALNPPHGDFADDHWLPLIQFQVLISLSFQSAFHLSLVVLVRYRSPALIFSLSGALPATFRLHSQATRLIHASILPSPVAARCHAIVLLHATLWYGTVTLCGAPFQEETSTTPGPLRGH